MTTARTLMLKVVLPASLFPVLALLLVNGYQLGQLEETLDVELNAQSKHQLNRVSLDALRMCQNVNDLVLTQVGGNLNVALDKLESMGGASLREDSQMWTAVNQYTKEASQKELPALQLGKHRLEPVKDFKRQVPLVDPISEMVGGTVTLFQRMNEAGDLLRVATTVRKLDGNRAIGTYIPAVNPDGRSNPVVSTIMRGETFRGRAFVVNAWYLTAYTPLRNQLGEIIGVLYVGVKQEAIPSLRAGLESMRVGETGSVRVLGGSGKEHGRYLLSPEGHLDGQDALEDLDLMGEPYIKQAIESAIAAAGQPLSIRHEIKDPASGLPRVRLDSYVYLKAWDWVIVSGSWEDEFKNTQSQIKASVGRSSLWMLLVGIALAAVTVVISISMGKTLTRPLKRLAELSREMADGNLDPSSSLQDTALRPYREAADLADGFCAMLQHIRQALQRMEDSSDYLKCNVEELLTSMEGFAEGDLTMKLSGDTGDEIGRLRSGFSTTVSSLNGLVSQIVHGMQDLAQASIELADTGQHMKQASSNTREQSAEVTLALGRIDAAMQSMSMATEGMTSTIQDIANNSAEAAQVSEDVEASASSLRGTAERLDESSRNIGDMVQVIAGISEQTNLLALNATIEAARAGEAGKGFAVVAGEVKDLAAETSRATEDIRNRVKGIQQDSHLTVEQLQNMLNVISRIRELQDNVSVAVDQQVGTTNEISAQIGQSATEVREATGSLHEVAQEAGKTQEQADVTLQAAESLQGLANKLLGSLKHFRLTQES